MKDDFESKLRGTPLRQPPPELRAEIFSSLPTNPSPASHWREWLHAAHRAWLAFDVRKIRPLTAAVLVLVSLTTLVAAVVTGTNVRGRSAWEAYADDARARGVKITLSELLPPPIPDAENFAAIPLFTNLFSEDPAARETAAKVLELPPVESPARAASMGERRLLDLAAWQSAFVKSGDLAAASADPAADVLRGIGHRFGPALTQLAGAGRRPGAVFPVKWEDGIAALLPHLGVMQSAAKIHQLRTIAHLARGESGAAYEAFSDTLRLYRALEKEPTLIAGLVRASILQIAANAVWEGLVENRWPEAELAKIQRDLGGFDLLTDYRFGMSSERAFMNDALGKLRSSTQPAKDFLGTTPDPQEEFAFRAALFFPGVLTYNQLAINRWHDAKLARVDPQASRFYPSRAPDIMIEDATSSWPRAMFYCLFRTTAPTLDSLEKTYFSGHTTLQLTRLACALERSRMDAGAYPDTLGALVPKYIEALPHDVIDGEPLRYRRTDDGRFLLYAVGLNGTDDGGATGEKSNARDHLDWAWRWPAP